MHSVTPSHSIAVLVGVQLPGVSDSEHEADLAELERLVHTLGYKTVAIVSQKRDALAAAAVLGEGKLQELAEFTGGTGNIHAANRHHKSKAQLNWEHDADSPEIAQQREDLEGDNEDKANRANVVVVDHEISPSQAHNLERATGARVLDRSGVIVEIFHRHAQSREARLQVEIARLTYVAPRLREAANSERQAGRGAGESALELDRRKIRDRIAELRKELNSIQHEQEQRRSARRQQFRVALVGYTNAGKSSLMRALTGSAVLVADKLFATLDTTVRALHPETTPRILVSDTVGFIKKLPHALVASFRSTLDEALEASLLLYVVDASDPTHESQLEITRSVLNEIGAASVPSKLVFNKIDRLNEEQRAALAQKYGDQALLLSARNATDVAHFRKLIIEFFESSMLDATLLIPYDKQALVGFAYANGRVLSEKYEEGGTHLTVRALPATIAQLQNALAKA